MCARVLIVGYQLPLGRTFLVSFSSLFSLRSDLFFASPSSTIIVRAFNSDLPTVIIFSSYLFTSFHGYTHASIFTIHTFRNSSLTVKNGDIFNVNVAVVFLLFIYNFFIDTDEQTRVIDDTMAAVSSSLSVGVTRPSATATVAVRIAVFANGLMTVRVCE